MIKRKVYEIHTFDNQEWITDSTALEVYNIFWNA